MRRPKLRILATAAVVLLVAGRAVAQYGVPPSAPPTGHFSGRTVSVLLTVTSDPSILAVEAETISSLIRHSDVAAANAGYMVQFIPFAGASATSTHQTTGVLTIGSHHSIDSKPSPDANPDEMVETVVKNLTRLLRDMAAERLEAAYGQRGLAERRAAESEAKVRKISEHLEQCRRNLAERGVFSDSLDAAFGPLAREALSLQVDLAGLEARRKVLVDNVARIQKKAEESIDDSHPELRSRMAMIKVCESQLERRVESNRRVPGSIPQSEIEITQAELEAAKAEFDARRRALEEKAAGILPELNQQLVETEVRTVEAEVRLKAIQEMLEEANAGPLAEMLTQRELFARALEHETTRWTEATQAFAKLQQDLDGVQPPRVRIIRLQEKPEGEKASEAAAEEKK